MTRQVLNPNLFKTPSMPAPSYIDITIWDFKCDALTLKHRWFEWWQFWYDLRFESVSLDSPARLDSCSVQGEEIRGPGQGYLVIKRSWPWGARTISGDHDRFQNVYFSNYKGYYMTGGDGARVDDDGYYWLIGETHLLHFQVAQAATSIVMTRTFCPWPEQLHDAGRVDDVINVSGHRIGTAEVEGALDSHPLVSEAAVVPINHDIKGQGIYAFVSLMAVLLHSPYSPILMQFVIITGLSLPFMMYRTKNRSQINKRTFRRLDWCASARPASPRIDCQNAEWCQML